MNTPPTYYDSEPARARLLARADATNATLTDLAAALRLPRRTVTRILSGGSLRWDSADRVAIALGFHPCEIWPDWFGDTAASPVPLEEAS